MALSIKKDEVDRLVREVCAITGESITSAIEVALEQRLSVLQAEREQAVRDRLARFADAADALQRQVRSSPDYRPMTRAELDDLVYDGQGLPA